MAAAARTSTAQEQKNRAFWLKHLHQWHWVSAAACLMGLILFSITGFTLNHASAIGAKSETISTTGELPAELLRSLQEIAAGDEDKQRALPPAMTRWLNAEMAVRAYMEIGRASCRERV